MWILLWNVLGRQPGNASAIYGPKSSLTRSTVSRNPPTTTTTRRLLCHCLLHTPRQAYVSSHPSGCYQHKSPHKPTTKLANPQSSKNCAQHEKLAIETLISFAYLFHCCPNQDVLDISRSTYIKWYYQFRN